MKYLFFLPLLASTAAAWGVAGHEITATIAQMLLTDNTRQQLCTVLPIWANCHLAPVAAWADRIKSDPWWRSWTSTLHYVNAKGDWPSQHCEFGPSGWTSPEKNLITAINNYTTRVYAEEGIEQDYALRFLVHYIGDLHQPMHLAGREKGGNGIRVRFQRKLTNLHSVWDGGLINKSIRDFHNYTHTFPEDRIERALRGQEYDPYVRYIVKEGLLGWWKDEYRTWSLCPTIPSVHFGNTSSSSRASLGDPTPEPKPPFDDPLLPVCPRHWAERLHELNCEIVFPPELDTPNPFETSAVTRSFVQLVSMMKNPMQLLMPEYLELDTPKYSGRIREQRILEKQLAMGGVRLAGVLNELFDPPQNRISRDSYRY